MFKVPKDSPIHILTANMFELFLYVAELAHHFAEAPSPPPSRTHFLNKLILDFLNIEAKHGEYNDRNDSPSY
jgi:hypothetical protein